MGFALNDYCKGALEALVWVRSLIKRLKSQSGTVDRVLEEVDRAVEDINEGIAVDFRERLNLGP